MVPVNFLKYSLIRLGLIVVVFLLCTLIGIGPFLAGIFAVLIGLAVGYLAFPRLHTAAGQEFAAFFRRRRTRSEARRTHPRTAQEDAAVEDEYVDEQLRREDRSI